MIYLALHGETEWNRERRFQGRLDSPLTTHGIEQAHRMGAALKRIIGHGKSWAVASSPLGRAQTTARIICEAIGIDAEHLELDERLAEIDLGSCAGLTREEVQTGRPGSLDGTNRYDWYFRSPDGESFDAVSARLCSWLNAVERRPHPTIAVTHGVASRVLRGIYANLSIYASLGLEVTRDAVFLLADGRIKRLPSDDAA
jgi:broad specificity phosphatase PhoE